VWVGINAPGLGAVHPSQFSHHPPKLGYSSQEGRGGVEYREGWSGMKGGVEWSEGRGGVE